MSPAELRALAERSVYGARIAYSAEMLSIPEAERPPFADALAAFEEALKEEARTARTMLNLERMGLVESIGAAFPDMLEKGAAKLNHAMRMREIGGTP